MERFDTVVVGGGQAGLVAGYELRKLGRDFVILDGYDRIGEAWRRRWDSLRLFTPARYCGLPGLRFPGKGSRTPTKDEMADYLEAYVEHFKLPVRTGVRVEKVTRTGDRFEIIANGEHIEAENVIVATGSHHQPRLPVFARELDPSIVQLHSSEYRNPSQLRDGGVLIVGGGNSGADISLEVVRTHQTWVSGPLTGHIPFDIDSWISRNIAVRIVRFIGVHVLTLRTPMGRKARIKDKSKGGMLVRVKPKWIVQAGAERVGRTVGSSAGKPQIDDGRVLNVANVIWCTGFRHDLSWIDLPVFDEAGELKHERGIVSGAPGLYFAGLFWQFSSASDVLPGVGRDARYVVRRLARRKRETAEESVAA
jgi:putative flavoprotein involved in K+ transport